MTTAQGFQNALERLADETADKAARIVRSHRSKADRAARLAGLLNRSRSQAVALADAWTARQIESATGKPTPARGLLPTDDSDRLLKAARTVLEDRETAVERAGRLGVSETLHTGQQAVTEALTGRRPGRGGQWLGWRRLLSAGACLLCQRLARGGRVWPADHRLYSPHPGCSCTQELLVLSHPPRPVRSKR